MQGELVNLWRRAGFTALLVTHDVEEALLMATRVIVLVSKPTPDEERQIGRQGFNGQVLSSQLH